jgi:predicted esterase
MRRAPFAFLVAVLWMLPGAALPQTRAPLDLAFEAYWSASSQREADKAAERILAARPDFAAVFDRLADGRPHRPDVETGELRWATLPGGGSEHTTTVVVPKSYLPAVKYPVRVFLHGGVARPEAAEGEESAPARAGRPRRRLEFKERYIAVYPSGYADAQWWFSNQMTNFAEILDRLKRTYNIDENRVHLMGVSDGGTGTYFAGLKDPTPWSALFPLNGFLRVLANPATRAEGELFTTNLTNRPLYVVNGENDPLYPAIAAFPFMVMLKRAGADITFRPMPGAGHDTSWWPTESNLIDAFEDEHPRNPYPTLAAWETERTDRFNRFAWLVIDRLDPAKTEGIFAENNTIEIQEPADFGLRVDSRRDHRGLDGDEEGRHHRAHGRRDDPDRRRPWPRLRRTRSGHASRLRGRPQGSARHDAGRLPSPAEARAARGGVPPHEARGTRRRGPQGQSLRGARPGRGSLHAAPLAGEREDRL